MRKGEPGEKASSRETTGVTSGWAIALMAGATLLGFGRTRDRNGSGSPSSASSEGVRGREADAPSEIPARGWKDILWRTYEEFSRDRLMLVAAGLTFYVLLAIFPAISALVSIYGLFADPASVGEQLDLLAGIVPGGGMEILGETMTRLASRGETTLGFGLVIGLSVALWSANAGMKSLFDALNIVYGEEEKRSFVWLTIVTLAFTLSILAFLILALGAIVVLPIAIDFLGLGAIQDWLLLLRWPVLLVMVAIGISVIFRYGPSREDAKWRWVSWGSAVASILWIGVSILFSWYVENFGSYDETYGSLGAAVGFMTWIWISSMVILLGAELNAEIEHQTARDTTTGVSKVRGERGAQMADSVGETKGE